MSNHQTEITMARQLCGRRVRFTYHTRNENFPQFDVDRTIEGLLSCGDMIPDPGPSPYCGSFRGGAWLLIDGQRIGLNTNDELVRVMDRSRSLWTDAHGVSNGNYEIVAID